MEKLIELANAGVKLSIFGPGALYDRNWHVSVEKEDDGIALKVTAIGLDLQLLIDDVHEKWVKVTGRGVPALSLKQIDYVPPALDDDIPF